jgi:Uma2 family endonuclease
MQRTLISNAEFELLPDEPGKQELLEGEVICLPPAKLPHSRIATNIIDILRRAFDRRRVFIEAGYQLTTHTWLVPDISVMWPNQVIEDDYLQGAPQIAVEVASRGNTAEEIERKTAAYLRHGAAEVWIVFPRTRSMMVHTPQGVERVTDVYTSGPTDPDRIRRIGVKMAEIFEI